MSIPAPITALPGRTPELAALLESWCNLNSGSGHGAGLERMRAALRAEFSRSFPDAKIEEFSTESPGHNPTGSRALSFSLRPAAPIQVLLNGHYDTVYESSSPFQACRWLDANALNGPGTIDMKGGLVTLLATLQTFEQTTHANQIGWQVLITPDEETGSHGSAWLFPVVAKRAHFAFIFEPARTNGDIIQSRKGTGSLIATCHGRAAHAAQVPSQGRNAILALSEFLLAASKLPTELPGVLVNVGNIRGGSAATNVVPDFAEAEIDIRTTKVADRAPLMARLQAMAAEINGRDGLKLALKGGFNRPPKECLPTEEFVFAHWQKLTHELGQPAFGWVHAGGGSDGNLLSAAGLPNLDGIGPIGDYLHSDREYCRVDTIASRAQIITLFLHRLAIGAITLPSRG